MTMTVSINPGPGMLGAFANMNYKAWYALGELVDNPIQSFVANRERLGPDAKLQIDIMLDESAGTIVVSDNAAGINATDFERALQTARPPADRTGLSQFGIGMKAASCWFAKVMTLQSTALGEGVERQVKLDVQKVLAENAEELPVVETPAPSGAHYTIVTLSNLNRQIRGRTVTKIKEHLASIYRCYLQSGEVSIRFNGTPLAYEVPAVLVAPYYGTPDADAVRWYKTVSVDLGDGHQVTGFLALRSEGKQNTAGLSLFRNKRIVVGSSDEAIKPKALFGSGNSFASQRLFGELHFEGFEVAYSKDGFIWGDLEEALWEALKTEADSGDLPLLSQANGHRSRSATPSTVEAATESSTQGLGSLANVPAISTQGPLAPSVSLPATMTSQKIVRDVAFDGSLWRVTFNVSSDPNPPVLYSVADDQGMGQVLGDSDAQLVGITLYVSHPFVSRNVGPNGEGMDLLVNMVLASAVAEVAVREEFHEVSILRHGFNDVIRQVSR